MAGELDFAGLAQVLLGRCRELTVRWLPGGKVRGNEWECANLRGEQGESLKVNLVTGLWADFAGNNSGGDLISLYAAIENISNGEAFKRLADEFSFTKAGDVPKPFKPKVYKPPVAAPEPTFGGASMHWCYKDANGERLFYIARYDVPGSKKQIVPFSWNGAVWVRQGWDEPRPLYGLEQLAARPKAPVCIVEGEKSAEAARVILGNVYVVVTWPNGAKAAAKADWSPLEGRDVLIWPDADRKVWDEGEYRLASGLGCIIGQVKPYPRQPGAACAAEIAGILQDICPVIKVINVGIPDTDTGWDAYDALAGGMDWAKFKEWALPKLVVHKKAEVISVPEVEVVKAADGKVISAVSDTDPEDVGNLPASVAGFHEEAGVATTRNGDPICNVLNVVRVLDGWAKFRGLVWYDTFHQKYFTRWRGGEVREWGDIDTIRLMTILQGVFGMRRISDEMVHKAIMLVGQHSPTDEPKDWMDSLVWDGKPRTADFFTNCLGVTAGEYTRAASRNWWISMAARVYKPACQVDSMVILESPQGKFKSTALGAIGGPWYAESHESVTRNDFYMVLQGKLLIEISELESFSKAEATLIKAAITRKSDRFRPPYGRNAMDFPRRCIFVGTTNESHYLKDATGGRRFWPIRCGEISLNRIREEREQLFAEAAEVFKAGELWHIMPAKETAAMQEARRQSDEWEPVIERWIKGAQEVTVTGIATDALGLDLLRLDTFSKNRVQRILRGFGWEAATKIVDGASVRVWIPPATEVK